MMIIYPEVVLIIMMMISINHHLVTGLTTDKSTIKELIGIQVCPIPPQPIWYPLTIVLH